MAFQPGVHVRRIHYALVSQAEPVLDANGEPYENTDWCWRYLMDAARDARYLGLIPARAIIDRRNPEPAIFHGDEIEDTAGQVTSNDGM